MARVPDLLLQGPSLRTQLSSIVLLLVISVVVWLAVRNKCGPCRAEVSYGGRKYRVPGVFNNKAEAERARDLLILVMQQLGIMSESRTHIRSRVPALQHPRSSYCLPGLAVLSITNDMRARLAKALEVDESTINRIACILVQNEARVSTAASDDGPVVIEVTTRDGLGYAHNKWVLCQAEQMGFDPDDWIAYHGHMLYIAFAHIMPRSFGGCIWDVEQHAKAQAQPGMLMRYEYMHYWEFLRRLVLQHVVAHWEVFKQFAKADHASALPEFVAYLEAMGFTTSLMTMSSSGDYQEWMENYTWSGRYTEALALCDLFQCCAYVIDVDQSCTYQLYPPSVEPIEGKFIYLHYSADRHKEYPGNHLQVLPMLPCTTADAMVVAGWSLPLVLPLEMQAAQQAQSSSTAFQRMLRRFASGFVNGSPRIPLVCLAMPSAVLPDASQVNRRQRPVPWTGAPDIALFSFDTCSDGVKRYSGYPFGGTLTLSIDSGSVAYVELCVGKVDVYPGVFECGSDDPSEELDGRYYWSDSEPE